MCVCPAFICNFNLAHVSVIKFFARRRRARWLAVSSRFTHTHTHTAASPLLLSPTFSSRSMFLCTLESKHGWQVILPLERAFCRGLSVPSAEASWRADTACLFFCLCAALVFPPVNYSQSFCFSWQAAAGSSSLSLFTASFKSREAELQGEWFWTCPPQRLGCCLPGIGGAGMFLEDSRWVLGSRFCFCCKKENSMGRVYGIPVMKKQAGPS